MNQYKNQVRSAECGLWAVILLIWLAGCVAAFGQERTGGGGSSNATNLTGVVAPAHGGLGYANTNLVPMSAVYDSGVNPYGYPLYTLPVVAGKKYYIKNYVGNDLNQFMVNAIDPSSFLPTQPSDGIIIAVTNKLYLFTLGNPGDPVTIQIWPTVTNLYGGFVGDWTGPSGSIPDVSLSGNVQLQSQSLKTVAVGSRENSVLSYNTANGSTFSITRAGTNGYADIGFYSATATNTDPSQYQLEFALGVQTRYSTNTCYSEPYLEMFSGKSFWFMNANTFYGGVRGAPQYNFVWFRTGTTNTPMFEIDRASGNVTNYAPVVCVSNVIFKASTTVAPTAASIGVNGCALWNSNGVLYAVLSANGTTIKSTTLLAQ